MDDKYVGVLIMLALSLGMLFMMTVLFIGVMNMTVEYVGDPPRELVSEQQTDVQYTDTFEVTHGKHI